MWEKVEWNGNSSVQKTSCSLKTLFSNFSGNTGMNEMIADMSSESSLYRQKTLWVKRLVSQGRQKVSLCGNELTLKMGDTEWLCC